MIDFSYLAFRHFCNLTGSEKHWLIKLKKSKIQNLMCNQTKTNWIIKLTLSKDNNWFNYTTSQPKINIYVAS